MQLRRFTRSPEHLDGLLRRAHRIARRVQQQDRAGSNIADDLHGPEVEHALGGLHRELQDRPGCQVTAKMIGDRHDVVARHHEGLARTFPVLRSRCQHRGEFFPRLRPGVLGAKLGFPVAPTHGGDDRGRAPIDPGGIERDRRAETAAEQSHAAGIDLGPVQEEVQRVAGILHLVQADDPPELALAVAAASHAESQRHVAPVAEHLRGLHRIAGVVVAAESMQNDEARAGFAGPQVVGDIDDAGELQPPGRLEGNCLFHWRVSRSG